MVNRLKAYGTKLTDLRRKAEMKEKEDKEEKKVVSEESLNGAPLFNLEKNSRISY